MHKVKDREIECYQSHDGRVTVQEFRWKSEVSWLVFVDGQKMFREQPTKEEAIKAGERKLAG